MMKRTFRRAGGMASKIKNNKDSLKKIGKTVAKTAGKLTPGGAVVGTLKDIRDRKSILNKRTEIKKDNRPNRDTSYLKEKAKKGKLYREAKKPSRPRLDKATIEKMNKARKDFYKKSSKRKQYFNKKVK